MPNGIAGWGGPASCCSLSAMLGGPVFECGFFSRCPAWSGHSGSGFFSQHDATWNSTPMLDLGGRAYGEAGCMQTAVAMMLPYGTLIRGWESGQYRQVGSVSILEEARRRERMWSTWPDGTAASMIDRGDPIFHIAQWAKRGLGGWSRAAPAGHCRGRSDAGQGRNELA